jgi:hypothetical protein
VLGKVLREIDSFQIVHSHLECPGFPLARASRTPVVSTLHGRLDLPELQFVLGEYADVPLVSISNAQRKPVPQGQLRGHGLSRHQSQPVHIQSATR